MLPHWPPLQSTTSLAATEHHLAPPLQNTTLPHLVLPPLPAPPGTITSIARGLQPIYCCRIHRGEHQTTCCCRIHHRRTPNRVGCVGHISSWSDLLVSASSQVFPSPPPASRAASPVVGPCVQPRRPLQDSFSPTTMFGQPTHLVISSSHRMLGFTVPPTPLPYAAGAARRRPAAPVSYTSDYAC